MKAMLSVVVFTYTYTADSIVLVIVHVMGMMDIIKWIVMNMVIFTNLSIAQF